MNIATLVFNAVQENTYIAWDETKECVIIDAGNSSERENIALESFIAEKGLKPVMAINTHGHFDHLMGVEFVRARYGVPFAMSSKDRYLLEATKTGSVVYGMTLGEMPATIDIDLATTKELKFGGVTLEVITTPGHTPGMYHSMIVRVRRYSRGILYFVRASDARISLGGIMLRSWSR